MAKIRFNTNKYDCIIDGNDLILQSLYEDVIFPNGGKELTETAELEFYALKYAGQRLNGFISEYIETNVQCYVDCHREDAQVIDHHIN